MSETERKNRFQISKEVQEEFVNSVATHMLTLAESAGKWQKPWYSQEPLGMPFSAISGREYSGATWYSYAYEYYQRLQ